MVLVVGTRRFDLAARLVLSWSRCRREIVDDDVIGPCEARDPDDSSGRPQHEPSCGRTSVVVVERRELELIVDRVPEQPYGPVQVGRFRGTRVRRVGARSASRDSLE